MRLVNMYLSTTVSTLIMVLVHFLFSKVREVSVMVPGMIMNCKLQDEQQVIAIINKLTLILQWCIANATLLSLILIYRRSENLHIKNNLRKKFSCS